MATNLKNTTTYAALDAPDQELIRRIAAGDMQAFEALYSNYKKQLFTYLLQLIYDEHVAEDLIQEVFVAAWLGSDKFRGQATVKTWLYQIAHNLAVTWIRRNQVQLKHLEQSQPVLSPDPEEQVIAGWILERMRDAIQKLSAEHRAVIELVFYHEMSYQEVAEIMQCPLGTVKSRMSYARRYLDQHMKDLLERLPAGTPEDITEGI